MAYDSTIPKATDVMSASQSQIQANFAALNSVGNGFMLFDQQATSPATSATQFGMYVESSGGSPVLFVQEPSAIVGDPGVNLTGMLTALGSGTIAAPGWCFLSSGLRMVWGRPTSNGSNVTVNFTQAFTTTSFAVFVSPVVTLGANDYVTVVSHGPSSFVVTTSARTTTTTKSVVFNYLAIGD